MRRLHPAPIEEVDAYDAYRRDDADRPLLRLNMVASLDGHIVDQEGVSGTLGGDGDQQAFFAMRNLADGILAGAGTVRADGYGPMRIRGALRERREADGRHDPAPIVVVTGSMRLDPTAPIFTDAVTPTIVLTSYSAPVDRVCAVEKAGGVVVRAGDGEVDLSAGIRLLREEHGLAHLLCEGGPTLNGQLFAAGLVDELCVTIAPTLVGGDDRQRIVTRLAARQQRRLTQVIEHDDELLLTYRRESEADRRATEHVSARRREVAG